MDIILQNCSSKFLAFTMAKMDECCRFRNRCFKALVLLHQKHLLLLLFRYCDLPRGNPYIDLVSVLILGRFSQCLDSWYLVKMKSNKSLKLIKNVKSYNVIIIYCLELLVCLINFQDK